MIQSALGIIDKMRIEVFDSEDYQKTPKKTIFVQLNPEKYTTKQTVVFSDSQPMGASGSNLSYNKTEGEDVTFDFLFDSSGIVPPGKIEDGKGAMSFLDKASQVADALKPVLVNPLAEVKSVEKEIEEFKSVLLGYDGNTHQTAYLQLLWGGYIMQCRLVSMEVEYYVFRKDGRPIRAKAKCMFKGTVSYELMVAKQKKSSPDMTHERLLQRNDKLTNLCETIYDSPNYYIDVANANNLLSFRNTNKGKTIVFPAIK